MASAVVAQAKGAQAKGVRTHPKWFLFAFILAQYILSGGRHLRAPEQVRKRRQEHRSFESNECVGASPQLQPEGCRSG